jgi:hypothetical protein
MITYWWIPVVFVLGALFGMLLAALMIAGGGKHD